MPDFCNCGAELPPDALFCHKCGKPQREMVVPETVAPPPPPEAPAPAPAAITEIPLNFHNPIAFRIALLVSIVATALSFLPFLNWIGAGFFAVFFYRRKTGSMLNVGAGLRLGWITGLLMFGFWGVIFTVQQIPSAMSGRLPSPFLEQLKNLPNAGDPMMQQMAHFLQSPPGIFMLLVFSLLALFLFIIGLSMAGGALGAKMMGRN